MTHPALPPYEAAEEVQNRAPCATCGRGLVCCLRPMADILADKPLTYWRHDRQRRALCSEPGRPGWWDVAPEQLGPMGLLYRIAMEERAAADREFYDANPDLREERTREA